MARGDPPQRCREVKVVLLGDTGVGKSSLAQRYVTNTFKPYCESTIGASFMSKMILDETRAPLKLQIWDTAGQEKYHSLAPMYYRGAAAAILVYDITKRTSLDKLKEWVRELQSQGPEHIVLCIAGNKSDLDGKRAVPSDDAAAYAAEIGAVFAEVSAKDDTNVSALFSDLVKRVPRAGNDPQRGAAAETFTIGNDEHAPRRGCCG